MGRLRLCCDKFVQCSLNVVHEHFHFSPNISSSGDKYKMGLNFFIALHFLHKYPNMTSDNFYLLHFSHSKHTKHILQLQIKTLVPYEHLHSDFQTLQKEQAKRRVTEPSVPPERADPQAEI